MYRFAGNRDFQLTRFFGFLVDIGLIILSLVTDMVLHRYQHIQFSTAHQLSNIFMTVAISCLCIMTSYHLNMHVLLFSGILDLRLLLSISVFLMDFCLKSESKQIDSLKITEHVICIHSCIYAFITGARKQISYSDLIFSSELPT